MNINHLFKQLSGLANSPVMPVMFIGHGTPMNVLPNNPYHDSWRDLGASLGKPQAILCVSAHWTTRDQTRVASTERPKTIYDFYNFPSEMYQMDYPAKGAPEIAHDIADVLGQTPFHVELDNTYGLDHGTWCVIKPMFPDADVPVFQLSIAMNREPMYHYQLGQALRFLRRKGVLIVSSGNIVHNLRTFRFDGSQYDWALEFDAFSKEKIDSRDDNALIDFNQFGTAAQLSINSAEHYYPLLYTLGLREGKDTTLQFNTDIESSLSMRSVIFSQPI